MKNQRVLVTGCAGFIGYHISNKLIEHNFKVVGIDNLNNYYSVNLKKDRVEKLRNHSRNINFKFIKCDICNKNKIFEIFQKENFSFVIHLAAQAGVRYSIKNPELYISSNIVGFLNVLEASKSHKIDHLYYASSSSVYGNQKRLPFNEEFKTEEPESLYGVTKKTNELMSYSYSKLYNLHSTGLRFFTVYGPWGRPDMAPILFLKAIMCNEEIKIFNGGDLKRDFTYIDDISNSLLKLIDMDKKNKVEKYRIFNVGNSKPVSLDNFINKIEKLTNKKFKKKYETMQKGDVYQTFSDTKKLESYIGSIAHTSLDKGLLKLFEWYNNYKL